MPAEISSGSTPAAKTAIPKMKRHHAFAGTTAVSVTGQKNLFSPAPTANRKTNAAAAHVCTPTTGSLFINDRVRKWHFLITHDLCTADGTTIHTYGWLPLSLKLARSS
jgi:hypothetical protein